MDTIKKYRSCEFAVQLVPDRVNSKEQRFYNLPERDLPPPKPYRRGYDGNKVSVDGWVEFYWPNRPEGEPWKSYFFPFRRHNVGDEWFANPDEEKGSKRPVWKWQNPEEPLSEITLNPSLGAGSNNEFHAWIRNGEVEWV